MTVGVPTGKVVKDDSGLMDLDNNGHRILIPHEVVDRVLSHADNIIAKARSQRAQNAAVTRRERQQAKGR